MKIGTVRLEEAKVFDSEAGYHRFHAEDGSEFGSFEIFWAEGWYWHACFPGCMPDGDASGPFASSRQAMYDADEFHPDYHEIMRHD